MIRAVPVVIIVLLLVVAVLGWMRPTTTTTDDSAHTAYVDSMNTVSADQEALIRTLWESYDAQTRTIDSLCSIRMNPEVFHREAAQQLDGAPLDSLINVVLEQGVQ